ncbi:chorion class CA protein ERA.1-like isoform X2 [Cydia strobilella]|uniref:chorion class CA protein ERA.1-like isoform X2 n=1 Tax=Cydia strobilella TaxID=1100964 RepID=UPI003006BDDC
MSGFFVLALCAQALLIQAVLSQQCGSQISYGKSGVMALAQSCASYGGSGTGQVGVSGDIGASGQTVVVGSVPVLGSVDFSGTVPASGSVSISGQCGCGCN